jgi:hypothetical protein
LPGTDVLPPGPLRDFVEALHELYGEAGAPGTRRISQDSRDRDDLPDTNSHEGVSGILRGAGVPRWSKVECPVRVLAARAVGRPDVDATVQRFHRLWSSTAGIGSATVLTAQVEPSSTAELITTLENPHAFELEEELRRRAEAGDEAAARSLTGSSDLSMVRSSPVWSLSVGCEHDAESVVLEVFEAVSKPADLLNDHVDGFGAAVGDP